MRFIQFFRAAMTVVMAAVLFVLEVAGEEPTVSPVAEPVLAETVPAADPVSGADTAPAAKPITAEPVPTAEPIPDTESAPAPESGSVAEKMTTAQPILKAEPMPTAVVPKAATIIGERMPAALLSNPEDVVAAKPVTTAEPVSEAESVPTAKMASADGTAPVAMPDSTVATVSDSEPIPLAVAAANPELAVAPEMTLSDEEDPTGLDPAEADPDEEGKMTLRELALQSHREQMAIYDLDGDGQISEEEWKAANEDNLARNEKFFLVDEDEDGKIDEKEAVGFLMDRVSLSSTYIDATDDETADIVRDEIKEHAPSELRVTLFSIPLGD